MADTIDRPELRKAMYHEAFETDSDEQRWDSGCWIRYKMFERVLDSMPPAQPEQECEKCIFRPFKQFQPEPRWIPCSERLPEHPENDDYYLVTIQCEHHDGWDDYVTGFAEWTKHGWDELSCYIGQINVVAWMPLPKPYKEETE